MPNIFNHDGISFRYEAIGQGPSVVFCHGLGGDRQQPKDVIGTLPGHRLVVWDARAHGETEPLGPVERLSFRQFAADLKALLDHLGIDTCVLGGISMGAGVATRFALEWPQRVSAAVLVRPAWLDQPLPENLQLLPRIAESLEESSLAQGREAFTNLPELQEMRQTAPDTANSLLEQFTKPWALERRARLERIPNDAPIRRWEEVERLKMPALVVGNEPDPVHPLEFAREWAQRLPQGRFARVPAKSLDPEGHREVLRREVASLLESLTMTT